jgi:hypothetical protein
VLFSRMDCAPICNRSATHAWISYLLQIVFCRKTVCSDNEQIFTTIRFYFLFVINWCALLHFKSVLGKGQGAGRRNDCCDVTNPVAAEPHVPASRYKPWCPGFCIKGDVRAILLSVGRAGSPC